MHPLLIIHAVICTLLVLCILLQAGENGMFSSAGMMSGGEFYHTRRGVEKILFYATFVLLGVFIVLNLFLLRG